LHSGTIPAILWIPPGNDGSIPSQCRKGPLGGLDLLEVVQIGRRDSSDHTSMLWIPPDNCTPITLQGNEGTRIHPPSRCMSREECPLPPFGVAGCKAEGDQTDHYNPDPLYRFGEVLHGSPFFKD